MKSVKRILLFSTILLVSLFLSSCINVEYKVMINKDGSCDVSYKVLMNSMLLGMAASQSNQNPLQDMMTSAQKGGFETVNLTDADNTGFVAKKHISKLEVALANGDPFGKVSDAFPIGIGNGIKVKRSFFQNDYSVSTDIDLSSLAPSKDSSQNSYSSAMAASMLQTMKFTFILGLPIAAKASNASSTDNNGSLLTWNLIPGQHNKVEANVSMVNYLNIALLGIVVLLIVAVVVFVIIRMSRKNKETATA